MRGLVLAVALLLGAPTEQAPTVVAESTASGEFGVAALQTRLNGQRRYALQVDGRAGVPFTARYLQVFVNHQPSAGGTGNDDGSFEGVTPYQQELASPAPQLVFWRYSVVISPIESAELTARVVDLGPR